MLLLLILTSLLLEAWASHITGYGNTTAVYGGEARYWCTIQDPSGVVQVTWQRLVNGAVKNLATYSADYGQQVNEPYRDKVTFTEASLGSASITLRNVTWSDESCYICSFHVYLEGSKRKQTCLKVQGISEVKTSVQQQDDLTLAFSCSATGKPAPTIHWEVPSSAGEPGTTTVKNGDGTFSSSSNITLKVPAGQTGHVVCLVNRGQAGQRQETIKFHLPADPDPGIETTKDSSSAWVAFLIIVIFISCIAAAAAVFKRKRSKASSRADNV